ncbi:hypothetical protein VZT92_022523 [Zoarces viviparus]|uniref:Uncharacterized protein n=1 Tax=Zoarces viviparus TaxID=48416 RepID=A0AAW1ECB0_ZOAVI
MGGFFRQQRVELSGPPYSSYSQATSYITLYLQLRTDPVCFEMLSEVHLSFITFIHCDFISEPRQESSSKSPACARETPTVSRQ